MVFLALFSLISTKRQILQHPAATGQHPPMRLDRMSSELCWYQCWQHTQQTQGIPAWHGQGNSALMLLHSFRDTRHRQARPVILGAESISWERVRAEPCNPAAAALSFSQWTLIHGTYP